MTQEIGIQDKAFKTKEMQPLDPHAEGVRSALQAAAVPSAGEKFDRTPNSADKVLTKIEVTQDPALDAMCARPASKEKDNEAYFHEKAGATKVDVYPDGSRVSKTVDKSGALLYSKSTDGAGNTSEIVNNFDGSVTSRGTKVDESVTENTMDKQGRYYGFNHRVLPHAGSIDLVMRPDHTWSVCEHKWNGDLSVTNFNDGTELNTISRLKNPDGSYTVQNQPYENGVAGTFERNRKKTFVSPILRQLSME